MNSREIELALWDKFPEVMERIEENEKEFKRLENWYNRTILVQVRRSLDEFKLEIEKEHPGFEKTCRIRFLTEEIDKAERNLKKLDERYQRERRTTKAIQACLVSFEENGGNYLRDKITSLKRQLLALQSYKINQNLITEDMIQRAKQYPIENLLKSNRSGFAHCLWHQDGKNPNMYIKNNFAHCFSCNKGGDTITIAQKIFNFTFQEAVKYLCER